MRDLAADAYRVETGDVWRPRHGSHTSKTGKLTSAAIDARDFRRARKDRETRAHLPDGTLIAVTGGKTCTDADAVWTTLDRTHAKHGDMVLLHGGGPGIETVAAKWAEARGVDQLVCRPDWNARGKAAPFRRNDELLNLMPKGVIAFPGSGITGNLVDKARQLHHLWPCPVSRVAARRYAPAPLALFPMARPPRRSRPARCCAPTPTSRSAHPPLSRDARSPCPSATPSHRRASPLGASRLRRSRSRLQPFPHRIRLRIGLGAHAPSRCSPHAPFPSHPSFPAGTDGSPCFAPSPAL